jgi:hypothetical protein
MQLIMSSLFLICLAAFLCLMIFNIIKQLPDHIIPFLEHEDTKNQ